MFLIINNLLVWVTMLLLSKLLPIRQIYSNFEKKYKLWKQ